MKRVTGNYYIPDLSKGLVDGSSKAKIDEAYKRKCSELTNFWIKNNNNIAKRPPMRDLGQLDELTHVIDVTQTKDRIVFLRQVDLNQYPHRAQETGETDDDYAAWMTSQTVLRRQLLEQIGWRPGTQNVRDDSNNITGTAPRTEGELLRPGSDAQDNADYQRSEDDSADFLLWEYGGAVGAQLNIRIEDWNRFPVVTIIESYDKETLEEVRQERLVYVNWRFSDDLYRRNFGRAGDAALQRPGNVNISTAYRSITPGRNTNNTAAFSYNSGSSADLTRYTAEQRAAMDRFGDIFNRYAQTFIRPPEFQFRLRNSVVESAELIAESFHHPEAAVFLSEATLEQVARNPRTRLAAGIRSYTLENALTQNPTPPSEISTSLSGEAIQFSNKGLSYLYSRGELTAKASRAQDLNESVMNTFMESPSNINIEDLEIVGKISTTLDTGEDTDVATGNVINKPNFLNKVELLDLIPDTAKLFEHLKFSLFVPYSSDTTHPTFGNVTYVVPDVQITVPGSDVWGAGRFLQTIEYNGVEYNAFAAHGIPNAFAFKDAPTSQFLTTDSTRATEGDNATERNNDPDINRFPNGTGGAIGELGVYIYLQRGNKIDSNTNKPIFYPIPTHITNTSTDETQNFATTSYILYLTLDPLGEQVGRLMDNLRLISMYGSKGKEGFNAIGAVQIGSTLGDNYYSNSPIGNVLRKVKIDSAVGNQGAHQTHVIPWSRSEYFGAYWVYGASDRVTTGAGIVPSFSKFGETGTFPSNKDIFPTGEVGSAQNQNLFNAYSQLNSDAKRARLVVSTNYDTSLTRTISSTRVTTLQNLLTVTDPAGPAVTRLLSKTDFYKRITRFRDENGVEQIAEQASIWRVVPNGNDAFVGNQVWYHAIYLGLNHFDATDNSYDLSNGYEIVSPQTRMFVYNTKADIQVAYTDGAGVSQSVTISRNKNSENYYRTLRERWLAELQLGSELPTYRPKITEIVNYFNDSETRVIPTTDRLVRTASNTVAFSEEQTLNNRQRFLKFSQGYLQFLNNIITVGRHSGYLSGADLGSRVSVYDRTQSPREPQQLTLTNKDFSDVEPVDYVESGRDGILATKQRLYAISGFNNKITGRILHETGFSVPALSDESMVLGAEGNTIKAVRYFEEANGYITDIVNNELSFKGNITRGVSLVNRHRIVIFQVEGEDDVLYTLAVDNQRNVKGFTKFQLPCSIVNIHRLDDDRIGLLSTDCVYKVMDFNADYNEVDGKWQDSYNGEFIPYECAVTPLPLLQVYSDDFSLLKNTTIKYLVAGVNGHPAFRIEILDGNTGDVAASLDHRRVEPGMIDVDSGFSGQVVVKEALRNGSPQPEIRISKRDDEFIEFSSFNIQLGG